MREDAKNHYAATLARVHGVDFTIAIVHDPIAREVYEHAGDRRARSTRGR